MPDFEKIAVAYGIKAKTLNSFDEIEECRNWIDDGDPALINIILPEDTMLQPKMSWNQKEMVPLLEDNIMDKARKILYKIQ